jgi:hypothetical protein
LKPLTLRRRQLELCRRWLQHVADASHRRFRGAPRWWPASAAPASLTGCWPAPRRTSCGPHRAGRVGEPGADPPAVGGPAPGRPAVTTTSMTSPRNVTRTVIDQGEGCGPPLGAPPHRAPRPCATGPAASWAARIPIVESSVVGRAPAGHPWTSPRASRSPAARAPSPGTQRGRAVPLLAPLVEVRPTACQSTQGNGFGGVLGATSRSGQVRAGDSRRSQDSER